MKTFNINDWSGLAPVNITHSFKKDQFKKLASHMSIEEIENVNTDEGRFFIHLKDGWEYGENGYGYKTSMTFGSISEAKNEMKKVKWVGK